MGAIVAKASDAQEKKDLAALELSRAGVSVPKIREQLGFRTVVSCQAAIDRARAAQGLVVDPVAVRDAELDRLDRLQSAIWAKAVRGDVNAIDRVLRLGEARVRLAGAPVDSGMVAAFEETVAALELGPSDRALVQAGRRIAASIDAVAGTGDRVAESKALYLVPHLMAVLRELGATPAAREELAGAATSSLESGKGPNELEEFKRRRGAAGA